MHEIVIGMLMMSFKDFRVLGETSFVLSFQFIFRSKEKVYPGSFVAWSVSVILFANQIETSTPPPLWANPGHFNF